MVTRNGSNTPETGASARIRPPVPPREVIEQRLRKTQERIGHARGVVLVVNRLLDHEDDGGENHEVWASLRLATEMLTDAIGDLEPPVILR